MPLRSTLGSLSELRHLFLPTRLFLALGGVVLAYVLAFVFPDVTPVARALGLLLAALTLVDGVLLFGSGGTLTVERDTPTRFSNGDSNPVDVHVTNHFRFSVTATVIDELPEQLQVRDQRIRVTVPPRRTRRVRYTVRPTERGAYEFGAVNVYVESPLGLIQRRVQADVGEEVPVYPSFLQMQTYGLLAASNRLEEVGVKKIRRLGHTMEFDHIRAYVRGDDYRTMNWKASARRGSLMVNAYRDERSQPVYCILNMGRVMQMPFDGLTLLDHSINASLVLCNIALMKHDRAGLIPFSHDLGPVVPAERRSGQMRHIQEALYRLDTDFLEADYARLVRYVRTNVRQRSLLVLFTNFAARSSLERQMPYLRLLARGHPLVVVFFENTRLTDLTQTKAASTEDVYVKTMAEKFAYESREIVRELQHAGIYAVRTPPENLTVETLNQYLDLKARGVI